MIYRAIGLMSGSSLDGLDVAFVHFNENAGKWDYDIQHAECYAYNDEWLQKLSGATTLNALEYQQLHIDYGHYTGNIVNQFIDKYQLDFKVQLIASHGHTTFHNPKSRLTAQLGDGASIAATTGLPVVSDLRAMDVALGGQGAPIVPIGDKLLLGAYQYCLNLGGIANISGTHNGNPVSFDIAPANRILNMLAAKEGLLFDDGGKMAASGTVNYALLSLLNSLPYYNLPFPKSLANAFGTDEVFPLVEANEPVVSNALATYVQHIVQQIVKSIKMMGEPAPGSQMIVTGGGALNSFLIKQLTAALEEEGIALHIPSTEFINFKEATVMALIGLLRWRDANNVLATVTGAKRDSIGGAIWMGAGA